MTALRIEAGFTIIELLVVVAIIGVLVAQAVVNMSVYKERARIANTVQELKSLETAFNAYLTENDDFPDDTHIVLPAGMSDFISAELWGDTPIGGSYNWEGPDFYPYSGIAFLNPTASVQTFRSLDGMIDDGNLASGKFRVSAVNSRYVYVINE